jgi:hypothetical protein
MTFGAGGEVVTLAERVADVERRYDHGHVVAESVRRARPEVERCIEFVQGRLPEVAASWSISGEVVSRTQGGAGSLKADHGFG